MVLFNLKQIVCNPHVQDHMDRIDLLCVVLECAIW